MPVRPGQPVDVGLVRESVTIERVTFEADDQGVLWAHVEAAADHTLASPVRLMLVVFDAEGRPLCAGTEVLRRLAPQTVGNRHELEYRLGLNLGTAATPDTASRFAVGLAARRPGGDSLVSSAAGGVVTASSTYGGHYTPELVIDGNPDTVWASATGHVEDEWLVVSLPGGAPVLIGAVGINPKAEPNYLDCAVADFRVEVSAAGTADEDFVEVLAGTCAEQDRLQRFPIDPVKASHVRLVCRTNRGNRQWMELTEFEVYAADTSGVAVAEPLAEMIEDFEGTGSVVRAAPDAGAAAPPVEHEHTIISSRWRGETQPPWPTQLLNCREGAFAVTEGVSDGAVLRFGRLTFDFGNLLGGAPQYCSAIFSRLLDGRPTRVQLRARPHQPGSRLRSTVWDRNGEWFLFEYAVSDWRGWRTVWIDIDPAKAVRHGGESMDNRIDYPVRFMQFSVNPTSRESIAGAVDLDDIIALRPLPQ